MRLVPIRSILHGVEFVCVKSGSSPTFHSPHLPFTHIKLRTSSPHITQHYRTLPALPLCPWPRPFNTPHETKPHLFQTYLLSLTRPRHMVLLCTQVRGSALCCRMQQQSDVVQHSLRSYQQDAEGGWHIQRGWRDTRCLATWSSDCGLRWVRVLVSLFLIVRALMCRSAILLHQFIH